MEIVKSVDWAGYVGQVFRAKTTGEVGQCCSDDNGFSVESRHLSLRMPDKTSKRFRLIELSPFEGEQDYLLKNGSVMD